MLELPREQVKWSAVAWDLSKALAPAARHFQPISSYDLMRLDQLLKTFSIYKEEKNEPPVPIEAHSSIACDDGAQRLIIRFGARGSFNKAEDREFYSLAVPIYDVAVRSGKKTDVVLRWATKSLGVFSPTLEILSKSPEYAHVAKTISSIVATIEAAAARGEAQINNTTDFMVNIPTPKFERQIFFGGPSYG